MNALVVYDSVYGNTEEEGVSQLGSNDRNGGFSRSLGYRTQTA